MTVSRTPISDHMRRLTYSVEESMTLLKAREVMERFKIRHLPVLRSGKLVGLLSDRDIKGEGTWIGTKLDLVDVGRVMQHDIYKVSGDTPLSQVVFEMAERKLGCAIVVNHKDEVQGIFTSVDAMRLLSQLQAEEDIKST